MFPLPPSPKKSVPAPSSLNEAVPGPTADKQRLCTEGGTDVECTELR